MNILFITESIPFPSRNGRELPTAEIINGFNKIMDVEILVISNDEQDYQNRISQIPEGIKNLGILPSRQIGFSSRIKQEIIYNIPGYFSRTFNQEKVRQVLSNKFYDWVWVSPASLYAFIRFCKKENIMFFKHCAIGMNDIKYGMYYDAINEMKGYGIINKTYILRYLRSFLLKKAERKYLPEIDLVHVQTPNEKNKVLKILSRIAKTEVIDAPNGIKSELLKCNYQGIDSNKILYMTQLNSGRKTESKWFITKVWPKIIAEIVDAELLLLGKIENIDHPELAFLKEATNVKVLGFVDDISSLFNEVSLAVVPIFHGTGLINRILDSLTAGLPTVSTTTAIQTFGVLQSNHHVLAADTADEFAEKVITLKRDNKLKTQLSKLGREYALQHPTWEKTVEKISTCILNIDN